MSDIHQELMNEAYNRWNTEGDLKDKSYNEMLESIDKQHRYAVVLGNLNYQVCNGGWKQWVQNGYCTAFPIVVEALQEMETETAETVLEMIDTISRDLREEVVNGNCESGGFGGDYFHEDMEGEVEEECWECNGNGQVECYDDDNEETDEYETCPECGGDGYHTEWVDAPNYEDLCNKFYDINELLMVESEKFLKNLK